MPDYPNPPVVEAVATIVFAKCPQEYLASFGKLDRLLALEYDGTRGLLDSVNVTMGNEPSTVTVKYQVPGYQLHHRDNSGLVAFTPEWMRVHALRPYCGGAEFLARVSRAVDALVECMPSTLVKSLSVSYMDVLPTNSEPLDVARMVRYPIPSQIPGGGVWESFASNLDGEIRPGVKCRVEMRQQRAKAAGNLVVSITTESSFAPPIGLGENLLARVAELKRENVGVFESLITDEARRLFA